MGVGRVRRNMVQLFLSEYANTPEVLPTPRHVLTSGKVNFPMAILDYTPKDIARFWSKVAMTSDPDKCWEWTASRRRRGYGQFNLNGKILTSHRLAWELTKGEITGGLFVCHQCDNPSCCNPSHLFLGTNNDNVQDMVKKGRQAPGEIKSRQGEKHGQHKLTAEQILSIRERYSKGGISQRKLAKEFFVTQANIWHIVNGMTWKVGK